MTAEDSMESRLQEDFLKFKQTILKGGVAEAMIYNDLFGKIGFVTIGIALVTLLISPIIKKLMHDIH